MVVLRLFVVTSSLCNVVLKIFTWCVLCCRISKKNVLFSGRGVRAKIEVELYRNPQGRLNVEIPTCEVKADDIATEHSGITG